jgi:hypothetical protein
VATERWWRSCRREAWPAEAQPAQIEGTHPTGVRVDGRALARVSSSTSTTAMPITRAAPRTDRSSGVRESSRPHTPKNEGGNEGGVPHQNTSQGVTIHHKQPGRPKRRNPRSHGGILRSGGQKKWWTGGELNSRHRDFQPRPREETISPHRPGPARIQGLRPRVPVRPPRCLRVSPDGSAQVVPKWARPARGLSIPRAAGTPRKDRGRAATWALDLGTALHDGGSRKWT